MQIIVIVSFLMMALSDALKMRGRDKAGKGLFAAGVLFLAAGLILSAMTGNRFHVSPLLRALLMGGVAGAFHRLLAGLARGCAGLLSLHRPGRTGGGWRPTTAMCRAWPWTENSARRRRGPLRRGRPAPD